MRQVWVVALTALLAGSTGCKSKGGSERSGETEPAGDEAERRSIVIERPNAAKLARRRLPRRAARRIEPIEVAEVQDALATPDGARVVNPPSKPARGERVQATYCFEKTTAFDATKAVEKMLEDAGWTDIHVRTRPERPDRGAVAAQRPPFRMSASVRTVPAPHCSGDDGHAFATFTFHKISMQAAAERGATP